MTMIINRRSLICAVGLGAVGSAVSRSAFAEDKSGIVAYPTAETMYEAQFVAFTKGFFRDAGLDCKMIQGGSGVKMRELVAASQADIGIGDITHPMQLSNHGRSARVFMPVDIRNSGVVFIIRKDLHDQGIDSLQKFAAWKRPDGHKPILGVSSLGGTNHVWGSYYMELFNLDQAVTWVAAGDVETMMGSIKTKQIDVLINVPQLLADSVAHGWGTLLFDGSSEENWNKYIGGKVPATAHFTLKSTIDKDPAKMQAYATAIWRATQWVKAHSADEICDAIEPFVGSTSRQSNIFGINLMKTIIDYDGVVDQASYDRGAKVWFRELTGIKPIPMNDIIVTEFVLAAKKAYPA
jgi:NitT/TauT family transport system substrate-binding protein